MQNLVYALIQVIHNFGAVTVVGTAISALWLVQGSAGIRRRLSFLIALAWAIQATTGALFGLTTYYFEGNLPDIHGIAVDALLVKIACVAAGFILAITYALMSSGWTERRQHLAWQASLTLGVVALGSAAFLRWFS